MKAPSQASTRVLYVLSAIFFTVIIQQTSANPFFIKTARISNADNNNNGLLFNTQHNINSGGLFGNLTNSFTVFKSFLSSLAASIRGNTRAGGTGGLLSSISSGSQSPTSSIDNDPDFDFSYFDNIDNEPNPPSVSSTKSNSATNTVNVDKKDVSNNQNFGTSLFDVNSNVQSINEIGKRKNNGVISTSVDSFSNLQSNVYNKPADAQNEIVQVNVNKDGGSFTNVDIPGILDLNVGGQQANSNRNRDSIVSVQHSSLFTTGQGNKNTQVNIPGILDLDVNGRMGSSRGESLVNVQTGTSNNQARKQTSVNIPGILDLDVGKPASSSITRSSLVSVQRDSPTNIQSRKQTSVNIPGILDLNVGKQGGVNTRSGSLVSVQQDSSSNFHQNKHTSVDIPGILDLDVGGNMRSNNPSRSSLVSVQTQNSHGKPEKGITRVDIPGILDLDVGGHGGDDKDRFSLVSVQRTESRNNPGHRTTNVDIPGILDLDVAPNGRGTFVRIPFLNIEIATGRHRREVNTQSGSSAHP